MFLHFLRSNIEKCRIRLCDGKDHTVVRRRYKRLLEMVECVSKQQFNTCAILNENHFFVNTGNFAKFECLDNVRFTMVERCESITLSPYGSN